MVTDDRIPNNFKKVHIVGGISEKQLQEIRLWIMKSPVILALSPQAVINHERINLVDFESWLRAHYCEGAD